MRSSDRPWVWFVGGVLLGARVAWVCCSRKSAPQRRFPDRFPAARLRSEFRARLAGTAADGRALDGPAAGPFVWVDAGDEVVVYPESLQVRVAGDVLLVSVGLETDQTGRSDVITAFALARDPDGGGLIATTNEVSHGDPLLVGRWGRVLQDAVWAALLGLARDHSAERGASPAAILLREGQLELLAGTSA